MNTFRKTHEAISSRKEEQDVRTKDKQGELLQMKTMSVQVIKESMENLKDKITTLSLNTENQKKKKVFRKGSNNNKKKTQKTNTGGPTSN